MRTDHSDWTQWDQRDMTVSFEHSNGSLGSMLCQEYFNQLRDCQNLKKRSSTWDYAYTHTVMCI